MLRKRIIPTLLLDQKRLIKTIKFNKSKYIGDPLNAIKIFNEKFVDELIILDISQNKQNSEIDYKFLQDLFSECFVPVTYGGGIKNSKQVEYLISLGVEKISINSSALEDRNIISEFAKNFGSQSVVVSVDVKKNIFNKYKIFNNKNNKIEHDIDLKEYIKELEHYGCGEIIINSVDCDGVMKGMDLKLIDLTKNLVNVPIIYCGGIGSIEDIKNVFNSQISSIAAGSIFMFYGPHKAVLITYPFQEFQKI